MKLIDTHLHLWQPARMQYPWLDGLPQIRGPFLPEHYQQAVAGYEVEKMIFVQAECLPQQNLAELEFVMEQAALHPRIAGMVAYAPLETGKTALLPFTGNPFVKGIRRMYDDAPDTCCSPLFLEAARALPEHGLSMDISTKPHALPQTIKMIKQCPDTLFILDHLGKPDIRNGGLDAFKRNMDELAGLPNVVGKLSGLITEANWEQWDADTVAPYIRYAVSSFGPERLMFGGDWPVVLLAGSWASWMQALQQVVGEYPAAVQHKIWYQNAERYYRLSNV